jgi:hypothetical protein
VLVFPNRQGIEMAIGDLLLIVFVLIATPLIFIGIPVFVFSGGIDRFAVNPLIRRFEGLELHEFPQPGDVRFIYHTYRGFLLWFVQEEHHVCAPPQDARVLLGRLLRFNLTWGMLSGGFVFVPLLAIGNYFTQRRSIAKQVRSIAEGGK